MTRRPSAALWLTGLVLVTTLVSVVVLGFGSVSLPVSDVADVLARRLALISGEHVTLQTDQIVWEMRLPRVLEAISVGAVLAICGALLQTLTGNALADPYLLGISSGASVAVVFVTVIGVSTILNSSTLIMVAAFVGAVAALALVLALAAGRSGELPPSRTVLAGVAVAQVCAAITSMIILVFGKDNAARSAMEWMLGSLAGARWSSALTLGVVAMIVVLVSLGLSRTLDAFAFGETSAASLGVNVTRTRWAILLFTALATAATVSFVGPIGFVGLTVPHIVRLATGPRHATLLPMSAVAGALLLLVSDTFARTVGGGVEIPIGIVTAIVGTPVLVYLMRREAR